jgi:hypothetical protein
MLTTVVGHVDREDSDEEGEAHQILSIDQYLVIKEKT